jgi:hypothetical protein
MVQPRFTTAKDVFPSIFAELAKELAKRIPECPNFTEEEIGFIVYFMLKQKVILLDIVGTSDSRPEFTSLNSIAIQVFVLKTKAELIKYYTNRRIKYSPFPVVTDVFPYVSEQLVSELSTQIPERTFTKDEVGFITLLLIKGVAINKSPCRIYFNEGFTPFDALIIGEFVRFYKNGLRNFHQDVAVLKTNKLLGKSF